jgi:hypothetical protein
MSQVYFGMKIYIVRTAPLSIIRSYSLYTQQCYMSYRFVYSFRAGFCLPFVVSYYTIVLQCTVRKIWKDFIYLSRGFCSTNKSSFCCCIDAEKQLRSGSSFHGHETKSIQFIHSADFLPSFLPSFSQTTEPPAFPENRSFTLCVQKWSKTCSI